MKTCAGLEVWLHVFLTSTLDEDVWLSSCPCRFSGLGAVYKRNICFRCLEFSDRLPQTLIAKRAKHSVLRQTVLWRYDGRSCLQPVTGIITWRKMVVRGREQAEMMINLER